MAEVDLLTEDNSVNGQKYVCVSFLSPDKILKKKELFFFSEFLKQADLNISLKRFHPFLKFISFKYNHEFTSLMNDFDEFVKEEKQNLYDVEIESEYKNFLDVNEQSLTETFSKENNFQTNVRGIKIRGSYETQQEAEQRCKQLRKDDPYHDIFVGPVGLWMPWDPDAYKTGKVEYLEKELNTLMKEKIQTEENAKKHFEDRVREKKRAAIKENIEKAKKHDIKLSQNIKKDGTLYRTNKTDNTILNELEKNVERNVGKKYD